MSMSGTHEPEVLGLSKALNWNYLPLVAKSNKTLQTEHLDLSNLSSLVNATLHTLEDAITSAANWVLKLCEESANLETPTGTKISCTKKATFQETTAKSFIANLKDNILSCFFWRCFVSIKHI